MTTNLHFAQKLSTMKRSQKKPQFNEAYPKEAGWQSKAFKIEAKEVMQTFSMDSIEHDKMKRSQKKPQFSSIPKILTSCHANIQASKRSNLDKRLGTTSFCGFLQVAHFAMLPIVCWQQTSFSHGNESNLHIRLGLLSYLLWWKFDMQPAQIVHVECLHTLYFSFCQLLWRYCHFAFFCFFVKVCFTLQLLCQ